MNTQTQKLRKKFLKELPIWDVFQEFKVEADKLKHDIDRHLDDVKETSHKLDSIVKLNITGKLIVHPSDDTDLDIVRLYISDKAGNCSIIPKEDVSDQGNRLYRDSSSGDSLEMLRKKLFPNEPAFVMLKPDEPWKRCKIRSVVHTAVNGRPSTVIKVSIVTNSDTKIISAKKFAIARAQNHGNRLRTSKRVIAGYTDSRMKSGIIGQDPCDFNGNRYLVLLDDGNARYYKPHQVYPICYQSCIPWKDHKYLDNYKRPALDAELTFFFKRYPRRHLLEAKIGLRFELYRNGMVVPARIVGIDSDVLNIAYDDDTQESIFAGSARIIQRNDLLSRLTKDDIAIDKLHYKIIGHMQLYHEAGVKAIDEEYLKWFENFSAPISVCGRTARKSTNRRSSPPRLKIRLDDQLVADDRESCPVLQELIDNSDVEHKKCTPDCLEISGKRTEANVENLEDEFRNVSDIKVPLLLGWKRMLVLSKDKNSRGKKVYVYETPCGRILNSFIQIKSHLRQTKFSVLDVDFFSFDREVILNRPNHVLEVYHHEENIAKDSKGRPLERKLISLVNPFNEERLPLDFEYRNETFPHPMLKSRGFSFNTEFKSGCDCGDDCNIRSACACHRLNELAAGTNAHNKGNIDPRCQYKDKRLMQQVSTGIFECNEFCSCSSKCPNRVVQNGIRVRLQVRKTVSKGWGVFALDDIPKGAFICTYSAELLDDADQYGADDMYFADLDYISVVEESKLALEDEERSDEGVISDDSSNDASSQPEERMGSKKKRRSRSHSPDDMSYDKPSLIDFLPQGDNSRYPRRNRAIGPSNGNKVPGISNPKASRPVFKPIFELLNEAQDSYTLDARMQGNIGRFFNHSCDPNTFVQNVFIETHDLRFPVVAFFTKSYVKADDEITWNYNYKIDSIAGRQILCNCSAPNCKGRIL